ncbi:hypothetical protein BDN72DRAFT_257005 [Pluteus cervinus]|uniref:Uncharacterized protein n=1 Tax=Pluteus cervinus TaxID=181527 RepID=A0ACD3B5U2_9AGAR|nr:hypothetical protein BDN72DRAFT_257005 [Pluteus cervinus]
MERVDPGRGSRRVRYRTQNVDIELDMHLSIAKALPMRKCWPPVRPYERDLWRCNWTTSPEVLDRLTRPLRDLNEDYVEINDHHRARASRWIEVPGFDWSEQWLYGQQTSTVRSQLQSTGMQRYSHQRTPQVSSDNS